MKKQVGIFLQIVLAIAAIALSLLGSRYNNEFVSAFRLMEYGLELASFALLSVLLTVLGGLAMVRLLFPNTQDSQKGQTGKGLLLAITFLLVVYKLLMGWLGPQVIPFPVLTYLTFIEWVLYSQGPSLLFGVSLGWLINVRRERLRGNLPDRES